MDVPHIRKQLVSTLDPTGAPMTLHVYHIDTDHIRNWSGELSTPVFLTADGEPVERYGPGMYRVVTNNCLLISIDPKAP